MNTHTTVVSLGTPWRRLERDQLVISAKRKHLEENLDGSLVQLTKEELVALDELPAPTGGSY